MTASGTANTNRLWVWCIATTALMVAGEVGATARTRLPVTEARILHVGLQSRENLRYPHTGSQAKHVPIPAKVVTSDLSYPMALAGRSAYAVVEARTRDGRVPHVLLFDRSWKLLGRVQPKAMPSGGGDWVTHAEWDTSGRLLGVAFEQRIAGFHLIVGTIDPRTVALNELAREVGDWSSMVWAGTSLVWAYQNSGNANHIMRADVLSGWCPIHS